MALKIFLKVLVVGNPANTNAFICAKYAAEKIPTKNFSAMTRLDHNRAIAQIAARCGVDCGSVKKVIIWGNHSSTQFPDVKHAKVIKGLEVFYFFIRIFLFNRWHGDWCL